MQYAGWNQELLMNCHEIWKKTLEEIEINDALRTHGQGLHMAPMRAGEV